MSTIPENHVAVEHIKARSQYLRGTIVQGLADGATGSIAEDDTQLTKFHGIYQQDDRDVRDERRRQMLEPDHSFMIRARLPGGLCSSEQWLALDAIASRWANNTLRLTTRQAFQFHGVLKRNLKTSIREINDSLLDTLAACGDVNRNVMCTPLPEASKLHAQVVADAAAVSAHLTPATSAYHEIWLDREKVADSRDATRDDDRPADFEPIYGDTYLPRKFKIAFAIPPQNDVDVLAHDLGFIAIGNGKGELLGYNVTVGGGMGATHQDPATFPRLADVLGFCNPEQVCAVAEAMVTIQRDFGERTNRKHARFKYTVHDHGLDWLREQLRARSPVELGAVRPFVFTGNGDRYGWQQSADGLWYLLLFIENGRLADTGDARLLSGMRAIARNHAGGFRLTPNQNVIIAGVTAEKRAAINQLVADYGLDSFRRHSALRLNAMACVAFPTCSLAMAEAERYLPELLGEVEALLENHGLDQQAITIRMTGCPNGCARPYLAEIGLVGKAPGRYNLHLGAAFNGTRLNRMVRENANQAEILETLDQQFGRYAAHKSDGENFGDFVTRQWALEGEHP